MAYGNALRFRISYALKSKQESFSFEQIAIPTETGLLTPEASNYMKQYGGDVCL